MKLTEESILKLLHKKTTRPMKFSELVKCLSIPESQRREFRGWIKQLVTDGRLIKLRGGRYGLPDEMNLVCGLLQGHPNGFGFLVPDQSGLEDIYISRSNMGEAMHGDRVMVRVESHGGFGRPEGRVVRILERKTKSLVGTYEKLAGEGWVVPLEQKHFQDVFVASKNRDGAQPGQVVVVEITTFPTIHQPPLGRVVEVLGSPEDPEVEVRSIFRKHGAHQDFPPKVLAEAKRVSGAIGEEERKKRRDLTDWMIFTIDGEKAKDFDDAVSLEKLKTGYRLGVHIADVSHFVEEGSALDQEAFERGTSIYFVEGVIPMLPFRLSNELCSLKPGVERLTVTILMDFDRQGNLLGTEIFNSIIKSRIRFTYTEVARLLAEGNSNGAGQEALETLKAMRALSQTLRKRRFKSGSVDFQVPEPEIRLDSNGRVENIVTAEHNEAHEIIEEFMLAANQVTAHFLHVKDIPSIHRIHEPPDEDKIAAFQEFIKAFGLRLRSTHKVRSLDLQNLLLRARNRPEERVINTLLLRAMKRARYSEADPGHFCLGFEHYTHFTSPIRRYPDLVVHRLIKTFLKRSCSPTVKKRLRARVAECAEQSSLMEEKATEIEREICDLRRAQFMADKIGRIYTGVVSSVTAFGLFVELVEVFVEGLIHLSTLTDDYYLYIEPEHKLQGQRRHRTFRIGDRVKVRVSRVDIPKRQIDFKLVEPL